jgi:hypothetical protein
MRLGWCPDLLIRQTSDKEYGQIYGPWSTDDKTTTNFWVIAASLARGIIGMPVPITPGEALGIYR